MGSIVREARKFIFHHRSKGIRGYARISVLLLSLTFTALLCITVDILDTNEWSNNLNNIEIFDGETRRGMDSLETSTMNVVVNMYPRRHIHSIHKKRQKQLDKTAHVTHSLSSPNKEGLHSSLKKVNSQEEIRTSSLKEKLNKGIQMKIHEKHPSPGLRYAQYYQTWPRKSEQAERRRQSSAQGHDLDGSSSASPINRLSSASIENLQAKSHRTHTQTHSLKYFSSLLKTKREEEAILTTRDELAGIEKPWENIIENDIFWGSRAEELVPAGLESDPWSEKARSYSISNVTSGCGRMQNRLVITEDGTKMCARYRMNQDQIQGEVFSYYLSRVLGIKNVPPLVLSTVDYKSPRWRSVLGQIQDAGWTNGKLVILSQWVPDLVPVYVPIEFHDEHKQLHPSDIVNRTNTEISELIQWSDMVIFDYLTANLDRFTNNMFNRQWNDLIMDSPVHNLAKSKQSGLLIFFDNESGLLHSYRLLDKFDKFHNEILQSLCIFRAKTVAIIDELYHDNNISAMIAAEYDANEPLHANLIGLPRRNVDILTSRIADVYKQIQFCRQLNKHAKTW